MSSSHSRLCASRLLFCVLSDGNISVLIQVRGEIEDVPAATVFDMLLDGDYRKMWDENVIEDYELCALDSTNDVGYYSRKQ